MSQFLKEIDKCTECKSCESVCPIYNFTQKDIHTPYNRLKIAKKIFKHEVISPEESESIYNCPKCEKCEISCPVEIKLSKIIGQAREELFQQGTALVAGHQELRTGILERKNSVKGDPAHLLDYLPSNLEFDSSSSTLFYAGCLSSYFLKEVGRSSVLLLKKANIPFRILKDEICCGSPLMDLGDRMSAREFFKENLRIFKENGINRLIVSCSGCYRCFKEFYPQVLGESIETIHIVDVLSDALKAGKLKFKKMDTRISYHDPCHLGREFNIYNSPRVLLNAISAEILEFKSNRENADCCGADSAVRAGFKDLSAQIALKRMEPVINQAEILTTACPFCFFNFSYAKNKNKLPIEVKYITNILLEALSD